MKAAVYTLGCKVNQYESEEMAEALSLNGYEMADSREFADIYIVNSCTVTSESNRKTRQAVRRFRAKNPDSVIVLTGCIPQAFPEEALAFDDADIILGNKNNSLLISELEKFFSTGLRSVNISEHKNDDKYQGGTIKAFSGHTRAFIKIQDGCNRFCSYCAIPYARGRSRSKPIESIRNELAALSSKGFREVVFVGINLSAYGKDIGLSLTDAVAAAENTQGIERVRLGSLEPDHITDEMIDFFAGCSKFCPQFHISLQSGCDSVLKRMNRHYNTAEYKALTQKLRSAFEFASITTDIITGFPGETQEEFNETIDFVKSINFEKVHVFPYSVREGTKAAAMSGQIENSVKSQRAAVLSAECENNRKNAFKEYEGKIFSVLFENPKNNLQCGYTKNYTPVKVECDKNLSGSIADVLIISSDSDGCYGRLV